ncbi:MAG: MarR family transcriptional regulator [Candidatus Zapsychrus exili]|nr:MarR family transcriptional regulator [Candidatus Zapsychrus exili]
MGKTEKLAKEIATLLPTYLRHVFPDMFSAVDLPPSQLIAVVTLGDTGVCRQKDLCEQMHVSAPTITGIVDRLEKSGHVKRTANKEDRRATDILLTKKGNKTVQIFLNTIENKWKIILGALPSSDQENYVRIFSNITKGLASHVKK